MGFCTERSISEFLRSCPEFERMLVRSGIILLKYWFSVSDEEQERRFQDRLKDPTKRWKLSPMDLESPQPLGGVFASQGRNVRPHGHQAGALVRGECGRQEARPAERDSPPSRMVPYEDLTPPSIKLPPLDRRKYARPPLSDQNFVPEYYR